MLSKSRSSSHSHMLPDSHGKVVWGSPKTWPGFFDEAKKISKSRNFVSLVRIKDLKDRPQPSIYFSVIASKKQVSKLSVKRHRAKRRLKSAVFCFFKNQKSELHIPATLEWVILSNKKAIDCSWECLLSDVSLSFSEIQKRFAKNDN